MSNISSAFPEVQTILERMRGAPPMNQLGVSSARENARKRTTQPPREEVVSFEECVITGQGGEVPIRIYRPTLDHELPVILYFHAGGWILGDLDHSDHLCRRLANRTNAVVINVGYRLAPEHRYPAAVDDCESALLWAVEQASSLRINTERIALAGESSGGNLAAALALRVSRLQLPQVRFLLLLSPALDASMSTASWTELGAYLPPVREQMRWMWELYLPDAAAALDPEASPSVAEAFANHPRTLIVSAELDPLRDEGRHYAEKLKKAGVSTEWRLGHELIHAFSNLGGVIPQGLQEFDRAATVLRQALIAD